MKGRWKCSTMRTAFRLGTCRLSLPNGRSCELNVEKNFGVGRDAERGIAIQPLAGFMSVKRHESDPKRRTHLLSWHSVILTAETEKVSGEMDLVALVWAG